MFKRFTTNYMAALLLVDVICVQLAFWLGMELRFVLPYGQYMPREWIAVYVYVPGWELRFTLAVLWVLVFLLSSVYTARRVIYWVDEFQRVLLAHTSAALSLAGLLYFARLELPRLTYLYFYLLSLAALLLYRTLLRTWHRFNRNAFDGVARILVVGAGSTGRKVVTEFEKADWPGMEFIGFLDDCPEKQQMQVLGLPVLGKLDQVAAVIKKQHIDEVLIALPSHAHDRLLSLLAILHEQPVRIRVVPDYFQLAYFGATVESLAGIPLIGLRDPAIDGFHRLAKRLFDIVVSALLLLVAAPLMASIALAIKLEDGGPILYRAKRVGENGVLFDMFKFRSMVVNADKLQQQVNQVDAQGNIIHKQANDPRITRVGRFIRRTSIDELPQLFNVLLGEMSLIGPRPELPWLVEKYEPWQRKRFAVPQGITGWWQVNGRSDNLMHLHTDQDLYYIQNYSLWLDFQILWRTVGIVLRGKGAY